MKIHNSTFRLILLCAISLILGFSQTCFAGAWTQNKGGEYVRLALNYYYATRNFDSDGDRRSMAEDGSFWDINTNVYCEYGLTENLTLISSLYYKYLEYEDNTIETKSYGISDIDLGVKYKLLHGDKGILTVQGMVKIPAYDEDDFLLLGNGQSDIEFRLLYGKSLWPNIPGYINSEIGYRFRLEEPSDEFQYLFEFGMDFSDLWYSRIKLDGILSMENADSNAKDSSNPSTTPEFDLGRLDIVAGYKITSRWAVEVGIETDTNGKNISAGTRGTIAVSFKRD